MSTSFLTTQSEEKKPIQSVSRTTQETSKDRIQELARTIGYWGGISGGGAQAIAQVLVGLEVRVTELEDKLERSGRVIK
jgi:hypothetical protein